MILVTVTIKEIWDALKAAAGAMESGEYGLASVRVRKKLQFFIVVFLENSGYFLNFPKNSKKFGEFLNLLEFSKIIENSLAFSYAFLNFLDFSRMLQKMQENFKNIEKYLKILENARKFQKKFKNSPNVLERLAKFRKISEFSKKQL